MKHVRKTYEGDFHYGNKWEINKEETNVLKIDNEMIVEEGEK